MLLSCTIMIWSPWLPVFNGGSVELHMIDVGQGDALALRTDKGRWIIFDAGRSWRGNDAGKSTVAPYIRRRGGEVHSFVLSHAHSDHVGGAASVLKALRPQTYWDAAFATPTLSYGQSLTTARDLNISWRRVHPNDSVRVDGVVITFLAPDSAWATALGDPNEASTIALVRYGSVSFLLVGDAERAEEEWLLRHARDKLDVDVLKVGHHGSRTSSTEDFIKAVSPKIALISVGADNSYGHPDQEVIGRLYRAGARVLRTDHSGDVVVRTDGRGIYLDPW
jgi:competence protein ComEC